MAWNEPGGPKDKDPWGGQKGDQGPPDLDEVVRKLQEKFGSIFGGKKGGGTGGGGAYAGGIGMIAAVILAVWALSGFYTIEEGYRGVVLQFGKYKETTGSGLHWHIPTPVETVIRVNVEEIRNVEVGFRAGPGGQIERRVPKEALMLTQDENIIDIQFAVQYKISDAKQYLFNVADPDTTLVQATESAVREVVGKSKMDFALKEGRAEIVLSTKNLVQEILDLYGAGLQITSVNMQNAQPPEQVQHAFIDAINAEQDRNRLRNEAEAYANDIIPKARGQAARMLEEAAAYRDQVVAEAEGESSRFTQLLAEYERAPKVTRERLYLDAMQKVLTNSSKIMIDVKDGNPLVYLPVDRLMQSGTRLPTAIEDMKREIGSSEGSVSVPDAAAQQRARTNLRSREVR